MPDWPAGLLLSLGPWSALFPGCCRSGWAAPCGSRTGRSPAGEADASTASATGPCPGQRSNPDGAVSNGSGDERPAGPLA